MSQHKASLSWRRESAGFGYEEYNRSHRLGFKDGRVTLVGDAAPEYLGHATGPDPEELLAASLAACHMLTFLAVAARQRLTVNAYDDEPVAELGKGPDGRVAVTEVTLRPAVSFAEPVEAEKLAQLHDLAHRNCFVARAMKAAIIIEPRDPA